MNRAALLAASGLTLAGCFALLPPRGGGEVKIHERRSIVTDDVLVPDGFAVEAFASGLDFPLGVAFDGAGTAFVVESGYSYGEVFLTPRVVRLGADGARTVVTEGDNPPWTGIGAAPDGTLVVSEGGQRRPGRILRIGPDGRQKVLVDGLPSMGDHHTNGPVVGPDGMVYFGQGTATNSGVVGPDDKDFGWFVRHPEFHDTPCADIELAGTNYESPDIRTLEQEKVATGAFVPFGTQTSPGQIVKGNVRCNGAVLRVPLAGGEPEVVAWGFRNPFGLAFDGAGQLYVTDNGYDVRGLRPIFGNADWLWKVEPGAWYGWPDHADGRPVDDKRYGGPGDETPRRILAKNPSEPPQPAAFFDAHSSADGIAFAPDPRWGPPSAAYVALFGDMTPTVGKVRHPVGYRVVKVDVETGAIEEFAANRGRMVGPASWVGGGGLERPVAVRFDPSGDHLYVVDFGVLAMSPTGPIPQPGTGMIWRIAAPDPVAGETPAVGGAK